jgi:hypothetical protein
LKLNRAFAVWWNIADFYAPKSSPRSKYVHSSQPQLIS